MDYETIKKIIKIAEEADISALSVEKGDFKVEVKRDKGHYPVPVAPVHQVAHPAEKSKGPSTSSGQGQGDEEGLVAITSPMVGTFYRASSPDSPPYTDVGSEIKEGTVVCIIEAMKLFNEIESEVSGKVVNILVENGKPVEYGQKLMLIKKR